MHGNGELSQIKLAITIYIRKLPSRLCQIHSGGASGVPYLGKDVDIKLRPGEHSPRLLAYGRHSLMRTQGSNAHLKDTHFQAVAS